MKQIGIRQIFFFLFLLHASVFAYGGSSVQAKLQKIIDKQVSGLNGPGAVLLIDDPAHHKIVLATGYSQIKPKQLMAKADTFRIASMTKTFVAVVIMQLIEQSKFTLDTPVKDLLPDINMKRIANGQSVTVRHLLTMSSGIPKYMELDDHEKRLNNKKYRWTARKTAKLLYDEPAEFKPGSRHDYSNSNFVLLELIITQVTGKPLAAVLQERIFEPLEMTATVFETSRKVRGLTSRGYEDDDGKLFDITDENEAYGMGDAGIVTNVEDLNKFIRALLVTKTLVSSASLREMLKEYHEEYGLGIYATETDFGDCYGHSGLSGGYTGMYCYIPKHQFTFIILINNEDSEAAEAVLDEASHVLLKS